jgi:hypothetical protein
MSTKRPSPVRSLILLNAGLLIALAGVSFIPVAQAQQARVKGQYAMITGEIQGSTSDGVFIVDASNMQMVATVWDVSRRTLDFVGFRDLRADTANTQARPR